MGFPLHENTYNQPWSVSVKGTYDRLLMRYFRGFVVLKTQHNINGKFIQGRFETTT